ncbi:MAG: hypothetical protein KH828_09035 [Clostridiales bacterium]|nr:hypothetical protein [Clostridiales bacterium]
MSWEEKCIPALVEHRVFLSPQHFSRFETAFAFLRHQRFFNKGLCKCAVLASWDQSEFTHFMNAIHKMEDLKASNLSIMIERIQKLAETSDPNLKLFYQLAVEFLTKPGQTPSETIILKLSKAWVPLMDNVIAASLVLDSL